MDEGREAKRAAFAKAAGFLSHVILCKFRNGSMNATFTQLQVMDLNKVEPVQLLAAHAIQSHLEMTAADPDIVNLFMGVVVPDSSNPAHRNPIALRSEFVRRCRTELGLGALTVPPDRNFALNMECNVLHPKLPLPSPIGK